MEVTTHEIIKLGVPAAMGTIGIICAIWGLATGTWVAEAGVIIAGAGFLMAAWEVAF